MSAMDLFIGELILGGYHSGASPFLRALWNALQLSPIWRCNILQFCFAIFGISILQQTLQKGLAKNILHSTTSTVNAYKAFRIYQHY